jgi:hypothetical protein
LYWEIDVRRAKGADEPVLERLYSTFSRVDAVVARFDQLELTLLWGEIRFDCFCCLIVHDIKFWVVPFANQEFKVLFVCIQYALRVEARDWRGEDGVGFVVVHHEETDVTIEGHEREVPVQSFYTTPVFLSAKAPKQNTLAMDSSSIGVAKIIVVDGDEARHGIGVDARN